MVIVLQFYEQKTWPVTSQSSHRVFTDLESNEPSAKIPTSQTLFSVQKKTCNLVKKRTQYLFQPEPWLPPDPCPAGLSPEWTPLVPVIILIPTELNNQVSSYNQDNICFTIMDIHHQWSIWGILIYIYIYVFRLINTFMLHLNYCLHIKCFLL